MGLTMLALATATDIDRRALGVSFCNSRHGVGATTPENISREIRDTVLALGADASIVWETHDIF